MTEGVQVVQVIKIKPATEQNVRLWVIWLKADLRRLGREPDLTVVTEAEAERRVKAFCSSWRNLCCLWPGGRRLQRTLSPRSIRC